jgi:hypothetical protein
MISARTLPGRQEGRPETLARRPARRNAFERDVCAVQENDAAAA